MVRSMRPSEKPWMGRMRRFKTKRTLGAGRPEGRGYASAARRRVSPWTMRELMSVGSGRREGPTPGEDVSES